MKTYPKDSSFNHSDLVQEMGGDYVLSVVYGHYYGEYPPTIDKYKSIEACLYALNSSDGLWFTRGTVVNQTTGERFFVRELPYGEKRPFNRYQNGTPVGFCLE